MTQQNGNNCKELLKLFLDAFWGVKDVANIEVGNVEVKVKYSGDCCEWIVCKPKSTKLSLGAI